MGDGRRVRPDDEDLTDGPHRLDHAERPAPHLGGTGDGWPERVGVWRPPSVQHPPEAVPSIASAFAAVIAGAWSEVSALWADIGQYVV